MPKKSKINIFNVMSEDELNDKIASKNISKRYYERLLAMRLISLGFNHKEVSEMLLISYTSVYRWAKQCEEKGLEGLLPNFNGGRKSKFIEEDRIKFKTRLKQEKNLSMTAAQNILRNEFHYDFSLPYVCRLVRDLGFNYGKPRPKFNKEPENAEEILKKTSKKQI